MLSPPWAKYINELIFELSLRLIWGIYLDQWQYLDETMEKL